MIRRIVEYTIDYVHRVQVGILSDSDEDALCQAQAAFDAGTIWDDTPEMPLLFDDFEEKEGETQVFQMVATVDSWPVPDASVRQQRREAKALEVCRLLATAHHQKASADVASAIAEASRLAASVVEGHQAELPKLRPRVVVGVEGGLVQGASSDLPVELVVVDYDMKEKADGAVPVPQSGGGESSATLIDHLVDLDPVFVAGVWQALSPN